MAVDRRAARAQAAVAKMEEKYGFKAASVGPSKAAKRNVISSGSLLWDYVSGVGGHPGNTGVEVFGPPEIGKSTIAGFSVIRNAQAMGMLTGIIAVEPYSEDDEKWMEKHGVNLDYNIIGRPDSINDGFNMALDWVTSGAVDYILFDSLAGGSSEKEMGSESPQAYGNSALITWGVNRLPQLLWKKNIGMMYINQIRDDTKSKISGLVTSPGGHAAKHAFKMRTQLKPGKGQYKVKVFDGEENKDLLIGREIIVVSKKNKVAQQIGNNARFDFYHKEVDGFPFGFDVGKDIRMAAMVSGVFRKEGNYYHHPIFPKGKINGKAAVANWVNENPSKLAEIRAEVLAVMDQEVAKKIAAEKRAKAAAPVKEDAVAKD